MTVNQKILWITSLRDFKQNNDDKIQLKFLSQINKNNIILCLTQFGEKNIKKNIIKFSNHVYFDEGVSKSYRYCQNKILYNGINYALENNIKHIVWSTADIILSDHFIDEILKIKENTICTIFPNIHIKEKQKYFDATKPNFGLDFFAFNLEKKKLREILKFNSQCPNYDWGCYEHFLFTLPFLLKSNFINLRGNLNIYKYENFENSFEKNKLRNINSWKKNSIYVKKFLKKNNLSKLFILGSFYYLSFRLFSKTKISFTNIIIYFRLVTKLIYQIIIKILLLKKS